MVFFSSSKIYDSAKIIFPFKADEGAADNTLGLRMKMFYKVILISMFYCKIIFWLNAKILFSFFHNGDFGVKEMSYRKIMYLTKPWGQSYEINLV